MLLSRRQLAVAFRATIVDGQRMGFVEVSNNSSIKRAKHRSSSSTRDKTRGVKKVFFYEDSHSSLG